MFKQFAALLVIMGLSALSLPGQAATKSLTGTITAIEGDHIQIKDQAGTSILIMLQKETKYVQAEKTMKKADLKVGTRVVIRARLEEKMKMYSAEEVRINLNEAPRRGQPSRQ